MATNSILPVDFSSREAIYETFPDEASCVSYLQQLRWPEQVISPFDENSKVYLCANNRYRCRNTGKYFNVKTNTIFHNSRISLQIWFVALWLVSNSKNGMSSAKLGRELQITQKTAWFMLQRIKSFFDIGKQTKPRIKQTSKPQKIESPETLQGIESDKMKMTDWLSQLKK